MRERLGQVQVGKRVAVEHRAGHLVGESLLYECSEVAVEGVEEGQRRRRPRVLQVVLHETGHVLRFQCGSGDVDEQRPGQRVRTVLRTFKRGCHPIDAHGGQVVAGLSAAQIVADGHEAHPIRIFGDPAGELRDVVRSLYVLWISPAAPLISWVNVANVPDPAGRP